MATTLGPERRSPRIPLAMGSIAFLSDSALLPLIASGNERAFEALYERYRADLFRYCSAIVRNPQDAEEAFQLTMLSAYQALSKGGEDVVLRPWLYRIAHNECISLLRKRPSASEDLDEVAAVAVGAVGVHETVEIREQMRQLRKDLETLPPRQRSALVLREMSGLSHAEVAIALGTTASDTRRLLHEARVSLTEFSEGRDLECEEVCGKIADGDRRVLRARSIQSHLRSCDPCAAFAEEQEKRRRRFGLFFPIFPAALAVGLLKNVLVDGAVAGGAAAGGAAGSAGAGSASSGTGAGAGASGTGAGAGSVGTSGAAGEAGAAGSAGAVGGAAAAGAGIGLATIGGIVAVAAVAAAVVTAVTVTVVTGQNDGSQTAAEDQASSTVATQAGAGGASAPPLATPPPVVVAAGGGPAFATIASTGATPTPIPISAPVDDEPEEEPAEDPPTSGDDPGDEGAPAAPSVPPDDGVAAPGPQPVAVAASPAAALAPPAPTPVEPAPPAGGQEENSDPPDQDPPDQDPPDQDPPDQDPPDQDPPDQDPPDQDPPDQDPPDQDPPDQDPPDQDPPDQDPPDQDPPDQDPDEGEEGEDDPRNCEPIVIRERIVCIPVECDQIRPCDPTFPCFDIICLPQACETFECKLPPEGPRVEPEPIAAPQPIQNNRAVPAAPAASAQSRVVESDAGVASVSIAVTEAVANTAEPVGPPLEAVQPLDPEPPQAVELPSPEPASETAPPTEPDLFEAPPELVPLDQLSVEVGLLP